jgi:hypothetical protein
MANHATRSISPEHASGGSSREDASSPVSPAWDPQRSYTEASSGRVGTDLSNELAEGEADGDGTDSRNDTPLQKRRRVTRACDECRRKKIKCDGKQPCSHCTIYSYGEGIIIDSLRS